MKDETKAVSHAQKLLLVAAYEIANLVPSLGKAQRIPEMQWYLGSKLIWQIFSHFGGHPKRCENLACTMPCGTDFLGWPTHCVKKHILSFALNLTFSSCASYRVCTGSNSSKGNCTMEQLIVCREGSPQCHLHCLYLKSDWSFSISLSEIHSVLHCTSTQPSWYKLPQMWPQNRGYVTKEVSLCQVLAAKGKKVLSSCHPLADVKYRKILHWAESGRTDKFVPTHNL